MCGSILNNDADLKRLSIFHRLNFFQLDVHVLQRRLLAKIVVFGRPRKENHSVIKPSKSLILQLYESNETFFADFQTLSRRQNERLTLNEELMTDALKMPSPLGAVKLPHHPSSIVYYQN